MTMNEMIQTPVIAEMPPLPAEPPDTSVVLDKDGWAWQNVAGRWFKAGAVRPLIGHSSDSELWLGLLSKWGPLTVIFKGSGETS